MTRLTVVTWGAFAVTWGALAVSFYFSRRILAAARVSDAALAAMAEELSVVLTEREALRQVLVRVGVEVDLAWTSDETLRVKATTTGDAPAVGPSFGQATTIGKTKVH